MTIRFNYDDSLDHVISKINEALHEHGLVIECDSLPHDGFELAEIRKIEKTPDPLEILSAKYYSKGIVRDVKNVLKVKIVDGSSLRFTVLNDVLGGDPLYGAPKTLALVYKYKGELKSLEASEGQTISLP